MFMPQTSPMNWMVISISSYMVMINFMSNMSKESLNYNMKNTSMKFFNKKWMW